jgi:hypothetical protein
MMFIRGWARQGGIFELPLKGFYEAVLFPDFVTTKTAIL